MTNPLEDPRVAVDAYVVRPTCYEAMVNSDRDHWCLTVQNGHAWGWSVRRGTGGGGPAMNRNGEWIFESHGSGHNKARRWPLEEALRIALEHVDTHQINGQDAQQASDWVAARKAEQR